MTLAAPGALTPGQRRAAYLGVAGAQIRIRLAYRSDFLFGVLALLVQIYLLRLVWEAVYPASGAAAAGGGRTVTLSTQIAYATLASVQNWVVNPWNPSLIPQRVREGSVAVDLARPVRFTAQMVVAQAGSVLGVVPVALVALPFAVLVGGAEAPASAGAALAYAASLLPGFAISLLLGAIISMVTFWTLEVSGMFMIYRMVVQFLSGALVPLWFMPGWLAGLAGALPFQSSTYTPIALYLGQIRGTGAVLGALAEQCGWAVGLWLLMRLVWARALRRVVVQGG